MSTNVIDPRRKEADDIRSAIRKMGPYDESMYETLLRSKEKGVLDVIHRVLDDDAEARKMDEKTRSLIHRPLHVIIIDAFRVIHDIIADLSEVKSFNDISRALTVDSRASYIGVLLMFFSAVLLIIKSA